MWMSTEASGRIGGWGEEINKRGKVRVGMGLVVGCSLLTSSRTPLALITLHRFYFWDLEFLETILNPTR